MGLFFNGTGVHRHKLRNELRVGSFRKNHSVTRATPFGTTLKMCYLAVPAEPFSRKTPAFATNAANLNTKKTSLEPRLKNERRFLFR